MPVRKGFEIGEILKRWNGEFADILNILRFLWWHFNPFGEPDIAKKEENGKYGYMNGTLKHKTWNNAPEEGQTDEFPFRMNSRFI